MPCSFINKTRWQIEQANLTHCCELFVQLKDTLSLLCYDQVLLLKLLDLALKTFLFIFQALHWLFFLLAHSREEEITVLRERWSTLGIPRLAKDDKDRSTKSGIILNCSYIYTNFNTPRVQWPTWLVLRWGLQSGAYLQDRGPLSRPGSC